MDTQALIEDICIELSLGSPRNQAIRLSGGYMHKMYHLQTEKGNFALKLLNPVIMKRSDVFDNYRLAETLEEKLHAAEIPIVPSLKFNGKRMQCIRGQYFYVFAYINGKALKSEEIQKAHCEIIGRTLAKIHKPEGKIGDYHRDKINIDWDRYTGLAYKACPEITPLLVQNKSLLWTSQNMGNQAYEKLPNVSCICNGDMDSKNVLWVENRPYIIDLECLGLGNPFLEFFELALCWSGYEHCDVDFGRLETFAEAYFKEYGAIRLDWNVLYCSNNSRLLWLEYNIKRALMIECENEEEQLLGIEQVKETIKHIIYYDSIRDLLIEKLTKLDFLGGLKKEDE